MWRKAGIQRDLYDKLKASTYIHTCSKTCLQITLLVNTLSLPWMWPLVTTIFVVHWDVPLDNATCNCPWLKSYGGRNIPTCGTAWPSDLLMVNGKHNFTRNCFRTIAKGNLTSSAVFKWMHDKGTLVSLQWPLKISASIICSPKWQQINLIPLHKPLLASIFHSGMTEAPAFSIGACGGSPSKDKEFRNSS